MAVEDRHVVNSPQAPSDVALQERPARLVQRVGLGIDACFAGPQKPVPTIGPVEPGQFAAVPHRCTVGDQLIENPREELIQDLRTARQQSVGVRALRHAPPVSGVVGQHVTLLHGDGPVMVGQHPGGEQPAHARSQNNRMLTQHRHGENPTPYFGRHDARMARRFYIVCVCERVSM